MRIHEIVRENVTLKDIGNIYRSFLKDTRDQHLNQTVVQRVWRLLLLPGQTLRIGLDYLLALRNPSPSTATDTRGMSSSEMAAQLVLLTQQFPLTSLAIRQAYHITDSEWEELIQMANNPQPEKTIKDIPYNHDFDPDQVDPTLSKN
jgi:hypothetical protein